MGWLGVMLFLSSELFAQNLKIVRGEQVVLYQKADLLQKKELISLDIPLLNYPNQKVPVKAIPMTYFLGSQEGDSTELIRFRCLDGFSGVLPKSLLLESDPNRAQAYLAIEGEPPWPSLPKKNLGAKKSAGPFYLVWKNPELSGIPAEFWPYQLSEFHFEKNLSALYPKIIPKRGDKRVELGFQLFQKRCLSCHPMKGQGPAHLGPDLSEPMSPTEYFKKEALLVFLEDPAKVRFWPTMKMRFVGNGLSREEALSVYAYLEHMESAP